MKKSKKETRSYLVIRDGWIPDEHFEFGEEQQRDAYIRHCRANYQESYNWHIQDGLSYTKGVCKSAGF